MKATLLDISIPEAARNDAAGAGARAHDARAENSGPNRGVTFRERLSGDLRAKCSAGPIRGAAVRERLTELTLPVLLRFRVAVPGTRFLPGRRRNSIKRAALPADKATSKACNALPLGRSAQPTGVIARLPYRYAFTRAYSVGSPIGKSGKYGVCPLPYPISYSAP